MEDKQLEQTLKDYNINPKTTKHTYAYMYRVIVEIFTDKQKEIDELQSKYDALVKVVDNEVFPDVNNPCKSGIHSPYWNGKCSKCGMQVFTRTEEDRNDKSF